MTYDPKSQMFAKVILASQHPNGTPLYTVHMRYPRPIHGEVMTHREFSRNARSSRAVPVKTMLEEVRNTPFIPWHWGANQKGMQAGAECDATVWNQLVQMPRAGSAYGHPLDWKGEIVEKTGVDREDAWLMAAQRAIQSAEAFMNAGYHKQIVNRLLEPFSWIDTLVTTTSFSNFLWLRKHKDAEPHLQDLALMIYRELGNAEPKPLKPGNWHLPYITDEDLSWAAEKHFGDWDAVVGVLRKISAARCARISYTPFDGDPSYQRELERYNMLVTSERVHASPLEHQATPDKHDDREVQMAEWGGWSPNSWEHPELHGNLLGWCQFRKMVPGEYHA